MKTLILDTNTTGLNPPRDKLVEVVIVELDGKVLLDTLVNPGRKIGFTTTIHHITDDMVATALTLEQLWPKIQGIVHDSHLIIYNAQFDTEFFPDKLECATKVSCAMHRFADAHGQKHPTHGNYKWEKLTTAADFIRYTWKGNKHRALAHALATRALWKWMERQSKESSGLNLRLITCSHCSQINRFSESGIEKIPICGKCGGRLFEAE